MQHLKYHFNAEFLFKLFGRNTLWSDTTAQLSFTLKLFVIYASMSGNPFLQPDSPGSAATRSKTIVRQKYVARQPSQEDYFDQQDDDVHGDFSEFEGRQRSNLRSNDIPRANILLQQLYYEKFIKDGRSCWKMM